MAALLAATPTSAEMEFSRAGAQDFVRNIPSMLKSNLKTFRVGTSTMWKNWGAAKEVQRAVLADSSRLSYSDLILIRKSKEDTNKFLFSGFIWMAAPELFPAMLYFNPRSIPSTFEGENGRQKRLNSMVRMRTKSALDLLSTLEEQAAGTGKKAAAATAHCEIAERLLRAKSTPKALAYLQGCASQPEEGDKAFAELEKIAQREKRRKRTAGPWTVRGAGKASLLGISPPALKAGCQLIGQGGFPGQPGFMRRGVLGKHLEQLVAEDAILARRGVASLSHAELAEACLDRGFGSGTLGEDELRRLLGSWLQLVEQQSLAEGVEPHRLRLAAMAACATASVRRQQESLSVLPRLLLA